MSEGLPTSASAELRNEFLEILGKNFPESQVKQMLKICDGKGIHEAADIKYLDVADVKRVLKTVELTKFLEYKRRSQQQSKTGPAIIRNRGEMVNVRAKDNAIITGTMKCSTFRLNNQAAATDDKKGQGNSGDTKEIEETGGSEEKRPRHDEANGPSIIEQLDGGTMKNVEAERNVVITGHMEDSVVDSSNLPIDENVPDKELDLQLQRLKQKPLSLEEGIPPDYETTSRKERDDTPNYIS